MSQNNKTQNKSVSAVVKAGIKKVSKIQFEHKTREIMRNSSGKRVHLMNINMKNKILKDVAWSNEKKFHNQTDKVISLKDNKHYTRLMSELKTYDLKSDELLKNVGEVLKCRQKFWVAKDTHTGNTYLVESDKTRVPVQYVQIV